MPRRNELARQWQLLQGPASIAVDDAARNLGCTVRTIWRDLRVLEQAGCPLYDDKAGDGRRFLWKLEEKFTLGLPVKLTLAKTAALLISRNLLRPVGAHALGAAVTSVFDKIGRVLSRDARQLLDQKKLRDLSYGRLGFDLPRGGHAGGVPVDLRGRAGFRGGRAGNAAEGAAAGRTSAGTHARTRSYPGWTDQDRFCPVEVRTLRGKTPLFERGSVCPRLSMRLQFPLGTEADPGG